MGKKSTRSRKTSRNDKRIEKLYADAIREVKERNININNVSCGESDYEEKKEDNFQQKNRKRPDEKLKETLSKQEESRKQRTALSVPVSRLLPFKPDQKGCLFPRDFRRESASLSWIPLTEEESPLKQLTEYNARRSLSSDIDDQEQTERISTKTLQETKSLRVQEILQVLPLRAEAEDNNNLLESNTRHSQLPPIYKQGLWRETMRQASAPSRSIPAKQDAWNITDPTSLMVGKQELYRRGNSKRTMSLAERRIRLRAVSTNGTSHCQPS